jgi:hypothetical protein
VQRIVNGVVSAALLDLPGSTYSDPKLSWRYGIAPSAIGFMAGGGLGGLRRR